MDKRRMNINYHELIIRDVQYEDAGEYKCEATNIHTPKPISMTFNLKVEGKQDTISLLGFFKKRI